MEKVTIVMPCYNDGAYLQDAFDAIAAQSYPNIEVIVVDDGSDDAATVDTLKQLAAAGRCTLLHQNHGGPSAARNLAVRKASGEFILPMDCDDRIDPTYVAKAADVLRANPTVGACYCQADYFGEKTGRWELPDYSLRRMLVDNVVFVTALIRRSAFDQAGGFDDAFRTGMEDYDFFLTLLEDGWEIRQIPEVLFFYRIKPASRSTHLTDDRADYHDTYRRLFLKHRELYLRHADTVIPDLRDEFLTARQEVIDKGREVIERQHTIDDLDWRLNKWKYRFRRLLGRK